MPNDGRGRQVVCLACTFGKQKFEEENPRPQVSKRNWEGTTEPESKAPADDAPAS